VEEGGGDGGNVHRPKKAKVNESRLLKQQSLPKSGGKNLLFGDDDDDDDDDFPDL
jgi:hypothetical protein